MKKFVLFLMMGSLLVVSCNKDPKNPNKPGGKDDDNGEKVVNPVKITLDGAFTDWDAITEESAKSNPCVAVKKGEADDPIQVLKISNDADNVYYYIEFLAELLPQNETCSTWGDSYNGTPELGYASGAGPDDDTFREVMHIFIDPDGNDRTGFYPFKDGDDPCIPDLGCENCAQFFMFFKPSTGLVSVAWEQTLIGPTKLGMVGENDQVDANGYTGDYDYNGTFCQDWPSSSSAEAAFPLWGWQNPDQSGKGDNDMPHPENWKPAPAQGGIAKVEFSIAKGELTNLPDDAEEYATGILFDWGESYQPIGPLRISYSE